MWALRLALVAIVGLLVPPRSFADQAIPYLNSRVTDLTGTLTPTDRLALDNKLRDFESSRGAQLAVLVVKTTQPEPIEAYSIRVVKSWQIGRKGIDDGVLFLIAKGDRRMRIEVGYGLEGSLTDATTKQIIEDIVGPHFKRGDFYHGIDAGLDAIIKVIRGEKLPAPVRNGSSDNGVGVLIVVAFGLTQLGRFLASILGKTAGAGIVGLLVFGLGLIAFSPLIAALMAIFMAFITFFATFWTYSLGNGHGYYSGSRYSGGSFGGGGFSGGGGSFGGGGSSGSW